MRLPLADTRPLAVANYRRLYLASIGTTIGAQITAIAVPAEIYSITRSSAYVGLAGLFGIVPLLIFGLWGGALADALDRRTVLAFTNMGLAITTILLCISPNKIWILLSLFALQQSLFAVNQPTRSALIARLLPLDLLPAAISLNMTVSQLGSIIGPMLGGFLIPLIGIHTLYLIDSAALFISFSVVLSLPKIPPTGKNQTKGLASILDGFIYLAQNKVLLVSFLLDLVAMVFGLPRALVPQIAHINFGGPQSGGFAFALLFAAMPIGAAMGGIFSGWISHVKSQGVVVVYSIVAWGVFIGLFGVACNAAHGSTRGWGLWWFIIAVVLFAGGGMADMFSTAVRSTMLQQAASDEIRGRLMGVFLVVVAGGPRLADTLHGAVAASFGILIAVTGGAVLVIGLTVLITLKWPIFMKYEFTTDNVSADK